MKRCCLLFPGKKKLNEERQYAQTSAIQMAMPRLPLPTTPILFFLWASLKGISSSALGQGWTYWEKEETGKEDRKERLDAA